MFASKSAMASDSSANAGSNALSGKCASPKTLPRADSRKDDRDDGRNGVVGREVRVREVDRFRADEPNGSGNIVFGEFQRGTYRTITWG